MNTRPLPSVFVSHGSPMIALEPGAAGAFMKTLGPAIDATFGRPRAIVVASAHTTAREPVVLAGARHQAVYDLGGVRPRVEQKRHHPPRPPETAPQRAGLPEKRKHPARPLDPRRPQHGI